MLRTARTYCSRLETGPGSPAAYPSGTTALVVILLLRSFLHQCNLALVA